LSHKSFRANLGKFGQKIVCTPNKLPAAALMLLNVITQHTLESQPKVKF